MNAWTNAKDDADAHKHEAWTYKIWKGCPCLVRDVHGVSCRVLLRPTPTGYYYGYAGAAGTCSTDVNALVEKVYDNAVAYADMTDPD